MSGNPNNSDGVQQQYELAVPNYVVAAPAANPTSQLTDRNGTLAAVPSLYANRPTASDRPVETSTSLPSSLEPSSVSSARRPTAVSSDFNRDGQPDIFWRNYRTGENAVWTMNGTTLQSGVFLTTIADLNWRMEGVGDFNRDNQADIVWRNYSTGQNALWIMNGTTITDGVWLPVVADSNWQIQGVADFTGDNQIDLLWRNYSTGQNALWEMCGTTLRSGTFLPDIVSTNLKIQGVADFNGDGSIDILWRNYLSGENLIWFMNGTTVVSTNLLLPNVTDFNWQIGGTADFNRDGQIDILWRNLSTGQNAFWLMNGLSLGSVEWFQAIPDTAWQIGLQDTINRPSLLTFNLSFSGNEGDSGTFQVRLNRAPTTNVTLSFTTGSFLVVDADGNPRNGTQGSITFTPQNWNQARTVWFIAENDGSSANRWMGNTFGYNLSGGLTESNVYELASVRNTYVPDPTRFNINLDFRNDFAGFWTPARRQIAQFAADDWAMAIANEWAGLQLNNAINLLATDQGRPFSFQSKRYADDLLVFVNNYQSLTGTEPGMGGPDYEFGGWITSPELMPRVGQIALDPTLFANQSDWVVYQAVSHEIGHVLGLVGLNWTGNLLVDRSTPQTAAFKGAFSKIANDGMDIPLQSQDGLNPGTNVYDYAHPANQVRSIMSYGWTYRLYAPTQIDYAMLADSGYRIYGINA